jgi:hypothetical protein
MTSAHLQHLRRMSCSDLIDSERMILREVEVPIRPIYLHHRIAQQSIDWWHR